MAEQQFFMKPQDKYYAINLNSITNPELQQKIKLIQNEGLILYIFDLSYNFNVPAVMSVIINPESKNTNINFGSFPVFDIAVERIITEIYQGVKTFKNLLNLQVPYRVFDLEQLMDFSNSLCGLPSFNESIFLDKLITVDEPNKDIYISDNNIDNEYINNYFINLFKSLNMSIHYINHSLIPEMAALEIFIPEHNYILSAYLNNANYDFDYIYENFLTLA